MRWLPGLLALALATTALAQTAAVQWRAYGPFSGFVGSTARHAAPVGSITDGDSSFNFLYDPTEKKLVRRKGTALLDSNLVNRTITTLFHPRARDLNQIESQSLTYPTVAALYGDDADSCAALYVRAGAANYILGDDRVNCYDATGIDTVDFMMTPLWFRGGLTRAANLWQLPKIGVGSRNFLEAGHWVYMPSEGGTPVMWNKAVDAIGLCPVNRIRPWGGYPALFAPTFPVASYPTRSTLVKPWQEGDKFYSCVIFRFEDGSYGPPMIPDLNATLSDSTSGRNAFVRVPDDGDGTQEFFDYIPWRNIPVGPHGTIERVLCRTPKTSYLSDNVSGYRDLRITAVIANNTETEYNDPNGDDGGLIIDNQIVRFDHMWPKRARYVFANDARAAVVGAVRPNPGAIILAPTGRVASRDLNNDTNGNGFTDVTPMAGGAMGTTTNASFGVRVQGDTLLLVHRNATVMRSTGYTLANRTVQDIVDLINTTAIGTDSCREWKAQLVPGADGESAALNLLQYSGQSFGDSARFTNANAFMWIRGPSWPGVLYFKDAMEDSVPVDHQTVFFTGGSPGNAQGTSLNFHVGNRRAPSNRAVGKNQGGAGVRNMMVIGYENAVYKLVNSRGGTSGVDEDYRLVPINESRGVVSPYSWTTGDGWVGYMTPEGYVVTDGESEALISRDVWHSETQTGEWANEMRRSMLAIAQDDTLPPMFHAERIGGQIHITYRKDTTEVVGSVEDKYPDRRLVYDFSATAMATGLQEVLNNGKPYGWSTPLRNNLGPMTEAMLDGGGPYRIGAQENNQTAAGFRGRLDKFDTGTTDGANNVTAQALTPIDFGDTYYLKAAEQVLVLYNKPATGLSFTFYRDQGRTEGFQTTLATSGSSVFTRRVVDLLTTARSGTESFQLRINDDGTSSQSTIWSLALKYKVLDSVR